MTSELKEDLVHRKRKNNLYTYLERRYTLTKLTCLFKEPCEKRHIYIFDFVDDGKDFYRFRSVYQNRLLNLMSPYIIYTCIALLRRNVHWIFTMWLGMDGYGIGAREVPTWIPGGPSLQWLIGLTNLCQFGQWSIGMTTGMWWTGFVIALGVIFVIFKFLDWDFKKIRCYKNVDTLLYGL